jgi:hypothetical protein
MNPAAPSLNDSGTPDLAEFLYLDRSRLLSYTSQLYKGYPVFKRFVDSIFEGQTDDPDKKEREVSETIDRQGGADAVFVSANIRKETSKVNRVARGGTTEHAGSLTELVRDRIEHDNLYWLLENQLLEAKLATPFDGTIKHSGLYLFEGPFVFFDWSFLHGLLEKIEDLQKVARSLDQKSEVVKVSFSPKSMVGVLDALSFSGLSVLMTSQNRTISAHLTLEYLTMTLQQMRLTYLRDNPVFGKMLAYATTPSNESFTNPMTFNTANYDQIFKTFNKSELDVFPISLYIPMRQNS